MEEILLLEKRRDLVMSGININKQIALKYRGLMEHEPDRNVRFGYQNVAISAEQLVKHYEDSYSQVCEELYNIFPYPPESLVAGFGTLISNQKPQ